ncbi:hypothetical protein CVIRNUC_010240 [Coccomyxa viridis]|uniref:DNA topoisomerase n=1 Tax=Coccomyxa viridis TaxID=1274662 RepID=A0AAV1IM36_9CHLO|nr:hypothetical protein CVIRNUC_010240 [Coccomyxa viridis]
MKCTVLLVAEKPSLSQSIAQILSNGKAHSRRSFLDVHEWSGSFRGQSAHFKMTSVMGHVMSIDFPPKYQNWETTDPASLFDAPTIKSESNPKAHVCKHLQQEARGCTHLVLWLDCDREGENICFEVIENTVKWMARVPGQQVFRARFSAISAPEITAAMEMLGEPNRCEALAVDARQELDLKCGVAFTRFQTRFFQGKYGNLDASVISYGPCQTPTLAFCVQRHQIMTAFQPEDFWSVRPHISKAGQRIDVEWGRGRLFDQGAAQLFQQLVKEARMMRCTSISSKEERRQRPHGLNTVEMLKIASSGLGMAPAQAMRTAEVLYTSGYLSYPRTESSAYPPGFDFQEVLDEMRRHPIWGDYAQHLMGTFTPPKGGNDVGDHPPITPIASATEAELGGGDTWRLYDYVARHFLGSLSPDCTFTRTTALLSAGQEVFSATGTSPKRPGFTAVMPWRAVEGEPLPPLQEGEALPITEVDLKQGKTSPPDYLTESELIGLMEKHGIGTDASIAVHINNICERNYVSIQAGRRVVPTELGITLVRGYQLIDQELCLPQVRAHVEKQIGLIAEGKAEKEAVVLHTLDQFAQKFRYFVTKIDRMDALFEASFSPLASSGKVLSKCGKCLRYMKLISVRPMRIYCPTCEEVLNLPQGGTVKLYKGLECPLDGYEIVLFSLSGPDGKTYALCPFCYNNPPFEGAHKVSGQGAGGKAGMPCTLCPHTGCPHSFMRMRVTACPECEEGTVVLDPVSGPKWRMDCNTCSFLIYLPETLHAVKLSKKRCQECESAMLRLDFKRGASPLPDGAADITACVVCNELVAKLCTAKHGRSYVNRRRGSGRRGRGRRGRGRGRDANPLLSFRDF